MSSQGRRTPWGTADGEKTIAPGIVEVTTPSHGGIHLDAALNRQVHEAWRQKGGWYEEDCEWAVVGVTFPEHWKDKTIQSGPEAGKTHVEYAHRVLKDYFPDEYGKVFGVVVTAAESNVIAHREFKAAHVGSWLTTSAWGHGNDRTGRLRIPAGWVGVCASIGGSRAADTEERWHLIPKAEYDDRSLWGAVIDPDRHPAWPEVTDVAGGPMSVYVGGPENTDRNSRVLWSSMWMSRRVGKLWHFAASGDLPERWVAYRDGYGATGSDMLTVDEALAAVGFRLAPYAETPEQHGGTLADLFAELVAA